MSPVSFLYTATAMQSGFTVGPHKVNNSSKTRIRPSRDTVTTVSGHLMPAELIRLSNTVRCPRRSTFISGQIHPPCVYHAARRGQPQSHLRNQLHDHTRSKPAHIGADTAETCRSERAWTHKGG